GRGGSAVLCEDRGWRILADVDDDPGRSRDGRQNPSGSERRPSAGPVDPIKLSVVREVDARNGRRRGDGSVDVVPVGIVPVAPCRGGNPLDERLLRKESGVVRTDEAVDRTAAETDRHLVLRNVT